jgi:hypothetical protein
VRKRLVIVGLIAAALVLALLGFFLADSRP